MLQSTDSKVWGNSTEPLPSPEHFAEAKNLSKNGRTMTKTIPIKTSRINFFREYLTLLLPILERKVFNTKISKKEVDVLAALLYYNNEYRDIPEDLRWKLVFDQDTKVKIRAHLKMDRGSFDICLFKLRKKGALKGYAGIHPALSTNLPKDTKEMILEFKFIIDEQTN